MRFFILSALCIFAVASARDVPDSLPANFEEIQAATLKAMQDYKNEVMINPEAALKKFMDYFKQYPIISEKVVEKRNVLEDVQGRMLMALAEHLSNTFRNKRDVREDIQNFLNDAQAKAKDAGGNFLKDARVKLMQAVQQFLKDAQTKAANVGAEVQKAIDNLFDVAEKKVEESQNVAKREVGNGKLGNVSAASLLKNIFNPKELQNQLTTVLINAMAGRNKRDVREDIQNFLKDAQAKAKDAGGNFLKDARVKLMQAVQQFLKDAQTKAANVGAEVQKAIDQLFDVAEKKVEEAQNVAKRDVREDIQNFLKDAQAKAKDAGGNLLKDARVKLMQAVQQFLKDAQTKAANVGAEVQKAIDQLFAVAEKKVEDASAQAA